MSPTTAYLDGSAAVKLVRPEPETVALVEPLRPIASRVSSELLDVELRCVAYRVEVPVDRAHGVLAGVDLLPFSDVLPAPALLDGELVCFDQQGHPDFELLRGRLRARTVRAVAQARRNAPVCLMIFDVLHFAGRRWRARPYCERRRLLDELALEGAAWQTPRAFSVDEDLAGATRELQLEGIVAKRLAAPYQPGRRGDAWLKHKHRHRERLTITAWRPGERRQPDEVLVSRRDDAGVLHYAGGVRFGLSGNDRARLRGFLQGIEQSSARRSRVRRVKPVVEVDVDYHGRLGGPLRDAVLRTVAWAEGQAIACS